MDDKVAESYNTTYSTPNFYRHRAWIYGPMIRAVLRKARVKSDGLVLDVGCGQGQFSRLLASCGQSVLGVDLSEVGIAEARKHAGPRERYLVTNITQAQGTFDTVFCRSFSPYNSADFAVRREWTNRLLELVRPNGVLIWCYNSKLEPQSSSSWRQHTLHEARRHFSAFDADVYFTMRLECRLGAWVLNSVFTRCTAAVCRLTHRGGELVAIIRKAKLN